MPADLAVLGLGHTGLPLAQAATAAGVNTVGYDPDPAVVTEINACRPLPGTLTAPELRRMLAAGFRATSDPAELGRVRTAVICSPTPLGADHALDLTEVATAARALAAHLRPHTTVVLESAVYPGTTEGFLRPLLEAPGLLAGRDFHLAYSPSRLDPGNRDVHLANTPKVVGGATSACTEAAAAFYSRFTDRVVRARGLREAEAVKLLETNYRHVNIAFANEMAVYCHDLGVDLWDVIRCAETKPFGFQAFRPGPGVGGPGAALDPNAAPAFTAGPTAHPRLPGHPLRMVELAQEVNGRMPRYVVQRAATLLNEHGKSLRGARVLLLGVTYKADLADQEGAPAREIGSRLIELGAQLAYHDPYVPQWRVLNRPVPRADSLWEAAAEADLTLLLQHHRTYDLQGLAVKAQLMLDTRGATPVGAAARL
ncbi:nucleotide sugar dehydrogenase [Streptomyces sp. DvalAA-14]|uniref:nucleotide sugar dehydrogenase n=1 Tax=unclassified Streptomyces TaxID=2593676 RepID=UPI00081AED5B|nr:MULTISPECIES: nucleotide sugar dehydrogenase [unclassified Streptomyces]MYS25025.1 nucleotide sugar dehydrogenase [Streptomyces sp. SID4948]SCE51489.1 nucleotide sugar dehydrogenase [Streptomyces sp. DvalAA-14]